MRRKKLHPSHPHPSPHPSPSSPPKRRRSSLQNWHTRDTELWAHAEWFVSIVDAPFFSYSEFNRIMQSAMGLDALIGRASRIQLARVRAAMCNAFPGRYAKPRRLSKAFLAAELDELSIYRTYARLIMRGRDLSNAIDPATGTALPHYWSSRYCCPAPELPPRETPIFVRTTTRPTFPSSQRPSSDSPDQSCPTSCLTTISTVKNNLDESITNSNTKNVNINNNLNSSTSTTSSDPLKMPSHPVPNPETNLQRTIQQQSKVPAIPGSVPIRPAVFLAFHADSQIIVRFTDDNTQQIVHDLDVMLGQPAPVARCSTQEPPSSHVPNTSPSSLPTTTAGVPGSMHLSLDAPGA